MTKGLSTQISRCLWCAILLLACLAAQAMAQTPSQPADARGVIRLRVRVGEGTKAKGLSRKRFFLIKGSLADNQALVQSIEQRPMVSRDCYYRSIGASEALIAWLKQGDCESVYCREVEAKDIEGPEAVPEFQQAALLGEKEFGSRELGRKWLTVNLREELRSGYYKQQQRDLQALLKQAEALSKAPVHSVMTDTNGTAFFTDVEPGVYVISNLLRTEVGASAITWNCSIEIKPEDLGTDKQYLVVNAGNKDSRDKLAKCRSKVEKPLPACPAVSK
jgi:hypothetical protein